MQGAARNRKRLSALGLTFVVLAAAWIGQAGAASAPSNLVRGVEVAQQPGKTTVTILGSARPSFTAFKLASPRRLIIDIAGSEIRGAPSLLDKSTPLVGGVAVSQYTSASGAVSRIVINLKEDAGYRVRAAGTNLVVTIQGAPDKGEEDNSPEEALRSDLERIRAEAEAARKMHDEARAELTQLKATSELRAGEANAARLEAQRALDMLAQARSRDLSRDEAAKAASKELAQAEQELSRTKSQLSQAEAALTKEQGARAERDKTIQSLEARLSEAEQAAAQAAQERTVALSKVAGLERSVTAKQSSAQGAKSELEAALTAQRSATLEYERSAEQEKSKLKAVLQEAQRRSLEAQRKLSGAEKTLVATRAELSSAAKQAQEASRRAEAAVAEQARLEVRTTKELALARDAQRRAEQAAAHAETKAQQARQSKVAAERQAEIQRGQLAQAREQATKAADEKVKVALDKAAASERARLEAAHKLEESRSRLSALEGQVARIREEAGVAIDEAKASANTRVSAALADLTKTRAQLEEAETRARLVDKDAAATLARLADAEKRAGHAEAELEAARRKLGVQEAAVEKLAAESRSAKTAAQNEAMRAAGAQELANRAEQELRAQRTRAEQAERKARAAEAEKTAQATRAEQAERKARAAEAEKTAQATRAEQAERKVKQAEAEKTAQATRAEQAERKAKQAEAEKTAQATRAEQAELKAKQVEAEKAAQVARAEQAEDKARRTVAQETERQALEAKQATAKQRKPTQEELRQARLAELDKSSRSKGAAAPAPSAPVKVAANEPLEPKQGATTTTLPMTVREVEFKVEDGLQTVVIRTDAAVEYSTTSDTRTNATLLLKGATLLPALERTLDVTDFAGIIESISSYSVSNGVRVDVKLSAPSQGQIERQGHELRWSFAAQRQPRSEPEGDLRRHGNKTIEVHREDPALYSYPQERTAAAAGELTSGSKKKRYSGRHVDLDFKDADIHNILRLLADVGQVNIVTADDVKGNVTIRMRDVAWDHALDVILTAKGLGMVREGNLIRVAPQEVLDKEREMELERRKARVALEPLVTRIIPNSFSQAKDIEPRAKDLLSDRGKISVDERTNVIIVQDTADIIDKVERLVRALDTQTPQVLIEARIVEASSVYAREIGIQWGGDFTASAATANPTGLAFPSTVGVAGGAMDQQTPIGGMTTQAGGSANPNFAVNLPAAVGTGSGGALGITLGSLTNNANLSLRLSAMEESGTLRILSSPKILTLDNSEARIETGTLIPYSQISAQGIQTSFKEAKLALQVTPHSTAEGSVLLNLKVTRDEPDFSNKGARGDPTILKREAQTQLLVNDGHTAVIGGIYTRNHGTSYKKVPFFGDIPVLGWLFKSRTDSDRRTEMLIFITPRIVNRAESIGG